jgi:hypothetical protein
MSTQTGGYCTVIGQRLPQTKDMKSLDQQQGFVMEDLRPEPMMASKQSFNTLSRGSKCNSRVNQILPFSALDALKFLYLSTQRS